MISPPKPISSETARILDGLFDHVLRSMNANHLHRQGCQANECMTCATVAERERQALEAYDAELRKAWG